ncbi:MAG TPA: protein tyrosine phosphatase family protein [Gammaproteobacteria bacterium]|nr:protein tyrosine phosphatase family protein [Gammaproteobacteria bacterium]
MRAQVLFTLIATGGAIPAAGLAQSLEDIVNYREYSATFASAGQPTEAQLGLARDAGFERVIYIAFSTDGNALANEDRIVRDLGMEYVQIPVVWIAPTITDYESFAAVMQRDPDKKTLLHCQVNARASAFSFLYRVLHENVPLAEAKADMNTVWEPNETWRELIFDVLETNGVSPECEGCDW